MILTTFPSNGRRIKQTDTLNWMSNKMRDTDFFQKYVDNGKSGFEINPHSFEWEWYIKFNNKSGFIVFSEYGGDLRCWIYKSENDLSPKEFYIKGIQKDNITFNGGLKLIKVEYRNIIQKS